MKMELTPLKRFARTALGLSGLAAGLALASVPSATARTEVTPYLEVQQVLSADLNEGGDVLTYTSLAGGIDASASTRRVEAQISYRYERRISWNDDLGDDDVHSGIAQARVKLTPGLSLDAGGLAARSRADGQGPIFGFNTVDDPNAAEVYSVYAGPTLSTRVGPLSVGAAYRLGYVAVDDNSSRDFLNDGDDRGRDSFDSSVSHNLSASVGMGPGEFPVGWTIGAGYVREDVDQLDSAFEGKYVRGDIVYPVSATLAVTAGVGYEKMRSEQDDIVRTAAGLPVLDEDGDLIADKSKPRLLTYDESGLIWDAGVIWRPSRRTELQARFGKRYGGETVTGSLRHEINSAFAVQASVYDSVSSFSRLLIDDVSKLPGNFTVNRNPLTGGVGGIGGCVFGKDPGTGACFDDVFQTISNANFRNRGANLLLSGGRGVWDFGLGAGYSQRKYVSPGVLNGGFTADKIKDQSFSLSANASRELSASSGISFDAYASWFDSGFEDSPTAFGTGLSASYHRSLFFDRMQGYAAAGIYTTDSGEFDSTGASALIGLRYTF